jgi:hypothetical protein
LFVSRIYVKIPCIKEITMMVVMMMMMIIITIIIIIWGDVMRIGFWPRDSVYKLFDEHNLKFLTFVIVIINDQ